LTSAASSGERDIRMDPPEEAKRKLRARLLNARRELTPEQMHTMAAALCDRLLATSEVRGASTVTAYVSIGTELAPPHCCGVCLREACGCSYRCYGRISTWTGRSMSGRGCCNLQHVGCSNL
jgi:hypothetical protein